MVLLLSHRNAVPLLEAAASGVPLIVSGGGAAEELLANPEASTFTRWVRSNNADHYYTMDAGGEADGSHNAARETFNAMVTGFWNSFRSLIQAILSELLPSFLGVEFTIVLNDTERPWTASEAA